MVERIHVHALDLFSSLAENPAAAGSLVLLDRDTENAKEETEIIHDTIEV